MWDTDISSADIVSYDYTASAFKPMKFEASSYDFEAGGSDAITITGGVITMSLPTTATGAMNFTSSLTVAGTTTLNGNVVLGNSGSDTLAVAATTTFTSSVTMTAKRFLGAEGADVAAANDLTLGLDGNFFVITGATQTNCLATANWQSGSVVILQFTSTPTIKNNQSCGAGFLPFILAAGADFAATASDTLTLVLANAVEWAEVARSVN
jgi:hypothetical protein